MIDTYLHFVRERHSIWEQRQAGAPQPWTDDPVLATRSFTNVYRIHDHGTQFVMELVNDATNFHDVLMRCFLYRYTNRPEPWEHFKRVTGSYPTVADLTGRIQTVWGTYSAAGHPIFGSAYKMFVGQENKGMTRLAWVLDLTKNSITPGFAEALWLAPTMAVRHTMLKAIPRCGDFMAMQILTDIGYSQWIKGNEDEFVVAGPGAKVGSRLVSPKEDPVDVIHALAAFSVNNIRLSGLDRPPSLMDVQNTLCEFGKYVRWSSEPIRKKPYTPQHEPTSPIYPEHWKRAKHEQLHLSYSE